ncbi:hypothetical protein [Pseudomonas asiatica]|uniref:hypothetical protein n=1 Tax=Pseudomonas asiatica TaxID=2219225 RepID=UPI0010C0392D|nr:hypothetical protein [Pseudomonas asiatica]
MPRQKKVKRPPDRKAGLISDELIHSVVTSPTQFVLPSTCDEAWSSWYGATENVSDLRAEIIESGIRLEGFSRSDLKLMQNGMLLSTVLLDDDRRAVLEKSLGVERVQELMPQARLADRTKEIIGDDLYENLLKQIHSSSSSELMAMTGKAIPQLGELMEVGGFSHEIATAALMLEAVFGSVNDYSSTACNMRLQLCLEMVVHLYLQMIPVRFIRECILVDHPQFQTMYVAGPELTVEINPYSPIFKTDIYWGGPLLLTASLSALKRRVTMCADRIDSVLETLQSFALAASPASRFTRYAVWSVIEDANELWEYLRYDLGELNVDEATVAEAGVSLEQDLIPKSTLSAVVINQDLVDRARAFRSATKEVLADQTFSDNATIVTKALVDVNKEISEAVTGGNGDFELLGSLSKKGADLSLKRNELISRGLSRAKTVLEAAQIFINAVEATKAAQSKISPSATDLLGADSPQETPPPIQHSKNDIESELLEINTHLETELKAAQVEIFRLNSANKALQIRGETSNGTLDQSFLDLARRHVQGQRLKPEELLRFYSLMAPDRLLVLDSAWKSSRQSENFANPERLSEHLCKLVFDYLDQVRAGTPMGTVGRELFAGAFAAKESQSVSQDASMRAQREFNYKGEIRFFEYRLRTGNGWGAVEGMRIYFDIIEDRMVIAYVGPHLDQPSTN